MGTLLNNNDSLAEPLQFESGSIGIVFNINYSFFAEHLWIGATNLYDLVALAFKIMLVVFMGKMFQVHINSLVM